MSLVCLPSFIPMRFGAISRSQQAWLGMEFHMMDVLLLALGLGFFALSLVYTKVCEGL